ncbi:hypothetical protein BO70DRAFT_232878 [Aspergillus heteromorphus CBS 117.55]|uniref:Zn(2)-C6 fungal-type domain-containing protein n=1 Tax=Aspergillus heteromorphus CBS 117.55 TaxID=1448321 RepID=A0A317WF03_9EURO|nr:uncharacterized protein BO70DRAFT_232878 [Aspergillus heteromorphus CBS 117.55]PWY85056.1 hypothetical protein BO70DRAFT_232878 [Aspergillus heteromorphus CBS 117.55]
MPLRRSHTKSHHGCVQCKQRRIKCDESRPTCGPCQKKKVSCVFKSHFIQAPPHHRVEEPFIRANSLVHEGPRLPLLELELLNHWHVATVQTLIHEKSTDTVLRVFVPQEALSHPFLMHSMLSLSALHLGHHGSIERRHQYIEAAMTHHNTSLSLCTPLLNNVTPENCHALFAFSCFVATFAFAAYGPKAHPRAQSVSDVLEVFKLVRGVASIVRQARPWIEAGRMRDLLQVGRQPRDRPEMTQSQELYTRLLSLHERQRQDDGVACYDSPSSVVARSSWELLNLLHLSTTLENPAAILRWPALMDSMYLDLLQHENGMALLVLAHYGVALDIMIESWWMAGWGRFLVNLVLDRLGPQSEPELAWAQEALNRRDAEH